MEHIDKIVRNNNGKSSAKLWRAINVITGHNNGNGLGVPQISADVFGDIFSNTNGSTCDDSEINFEEVSEKKLRFLLF